MHRGATSWACCAPAAAHARTHARTHACTHARAHARMRARTHAHGHAGLLAWTTAAVLLETPPAAPRAAAVCGCISHAVRLVTSQWSIVQAPVMRQCTPVPGRTHPTCLPRTPVLVEVCAHVEEHKAVKPPFERAAPVKGAVGVQTERKWACVEYTRQRGCGCAQCTWFASQTPVEAAPRELGGGVSVGAFM
jgi:hypothetical protein